jgi:glycosyltransferase involved in cell wall biosynthesis
MSFKVANVICTFNSGSGGPPRTVSMIAEAGVGHWRAELFTTDYTASASDVLLTSEFPGRVNLIPRGAQTLAGGIARAIKTPAGMRVQLLSRCRPDIVHLHGIWNPLLLVYARMARGANIPYIVAPHGMLEPWSLSVNPIRKRFAIHSYQGRVLARAAAIHTTSELEARNLRNLRMTSAPIVVVPNAVVDPRASDGGDRKPLDGRKVLLFLSRVHEKKGLDNLLKAWNTLRPDEWTLRIVGHGEQAYVEQLKRTCETHQIPNVEFHPHVDGARREAMFAAASAFILPTFSENFGNAVAEAMIRGLPVITTTGTPWSVIREQGLGWYIDPTVDQEIAALRELFATDAAALRQTGARAQRYARENLVNSAVRPLLLDMYRSVLRSGRAAGA